MEKRERPKSPEEAIREAKRYFKNAKDILKETPIEYGIRYGDSKRVSEACAIGYLAVLLAIDAYILKKGKKPEELPADYREYMQWLNKIPHNGKLKAHFNTAYEVLHILGYYRGGKSVNVIKEGFKSAKFIIDTFDKLFNKKKGVKNGRKTTNARNTN